MNADTIREALRSDFDATLRTLADHIAQTYTGPEDTRVPIAHAIARHLGLEGWPSASPWRPIESAPRDGSMVLLTDGHYVDCGFYHDGSECYGHRGGAGFFAEEDRGNLLTASNFHATHWMPLPEPPKGGEDA